MRFTSFILVFFALLLNHSNSLAQFDDNSASSIQSSSSSLSSDNALVSNEEEFLPVEQAYILNVDFEGNKHDQFNQLRLNWQIASGYYLYRHSFKFELTSSQMRESVIDINANIPGGKVKNDEYFGRVEVYYHNLDIELDKIPQGESLTLAVTSQGCADAGLCYPPRTQYFDINAVKGTVAPIDKPKGENQNPINTASTVESDGAISETTQSLPYMLLLAILGGAILNLMPCVFPVLSLKVLSFANDKEHNQVVHGMVYSIGVVVSFIAVAALLISLQAAGEAVGWGFHLQSPWFVAALTYLFFVMGLSLSGFIELGAQWMNTGSSLASKSGYGGSFFTGILATVVASPCTAPFMGTALGFAVTQSVPIALSVFAALGFGMALPVLLLSCSPSLLNKIPKPGPWMVHLKEFLAFPLYATAVWLCWVVGNQSGVNAMAVVLLGCVMITLAIWLWDQGPIKRTLSAVSAALAIATLSSSFLTADTSKQTESSGNWQAYSPETLEQLRQQGKPVFINITADWCITCLANEKITLNTDRVKQAFVDTGVTYLKGDWTNHDSTITKLLNKHGRTGIPLYVVYPSGNEKQATLLPQILTTEVLIDALAQAGK